VVAAEGAESTTVGDPARLSANTGPAAAAAAAAVRGEKLFVRVGMCAVVVDRRGCDRGWGRTVDRAAAAAAAAAAAVS